MSKVIVIGPRDQRIPEGSVVINTTSRSKTWSKGLSPFFLGPCKLYNGLVSVTMENAWQYAKVYKSYINKDGEPSTAYWTWAKAGWQNPRAVRYPFGRGAVPAYSFGI